MRRIAHQTSGAIKHAVGAGSGWEFQPGDRVLADSLPGVVDSVDDTNPMGIESYQVTLDNGLGGGEYTAAQLQRPGGTTASLVDQQSVSEPLGAVEEGTQHTADYWYPELGSILTDRPPNERVQHTANRKTAVGGPSEFLFAPGTKVMAAGQPGFVVRVTAPPNDDPFAQHQYVVGFYGGQGQQVYPQGQLVRMAMGQVESSKQYPHGHVNGVEITDHEYSGESGIIQCNNCGKYHSATYDHDGRFGEGRIHAVVCPEDHLTDYYTDGVLRQRPKYPARGSVKKQGAEVPPDAANEDGSAGPENAFDSSAQPDTCSFCGNPGPWGDEQDTGRGTRIRCGTCGGTMRLNDDEAAGTSGIQWQPEFSNSPQNAASRAGDPRASVNDIRVVHAAQGAGNYSEGLSRVHEANDENFARMSEGGFYHPKCDPADGDTEGISFGELRSKMPHGVTCDHCGQDIVEPRPHHENECGYGGPPEEGGGCLEGHTEHHHDWGSDDDLRTQQQEQGDWEHTLHQRHQDEHDTGQHIDEMFSGHPGMDMLRTNPTNPTHHSGLERRTDENGWHRDRRPGYELDESRCAANKHGPWNSEGRCQRCGYSAGDTPEHDDLINSAFEGTHSDASWLLGQNNQGPSKYSRFNALATEQAGYAIFTAPELHGQLTHQLTATAASLNGIADEDFVFSFTATWADVRKKATRIRSEGGVRIVAASAASVVGEVQGDTMLYESVLNYVPGTKKVADWACGCRWGAYAWGRSSAYKRFEGRQCSHVLALQFEANSRGMFGREVGHDRERMDGQHQRTPVVTEYQRPTDRHPGGDLTRRTVPPGNMRSEWAPNSRVRVKGSMKPPSFNPESDWFRGHQRRFLTESPEICSCGEEIVPDEYAQDTYLDRNANEEGPDGHWHGPSNELHVGKLVVLDDVPPSHEWARVCTALGTPPSEVLQAMQALGVPHAAARAALDWAIASDASATVLTDDGQAHRVLAVTDGIVHTASGAQLAEHEARLVLAKDRTKDDSEDATADLDGGQADPGTDIPRIEDRDQSDAKRKKHHVLHHTNDGRMHAPDWGYGVPWGGTYAWCDQCGGSGCGHCQGTGQVLAPSDGSPGTSDASTTNSPLADQSVDAGDMIGDNASGMTATASLNYTDPRATKAFDYGHEQGYSDAGHGYEPTPHLIAQTWYDRHNHDAVMDGYEHGHSTWHNEHTAALSAPCETLGAQYSTSVEGDSASIKVDVPFNLPIETASDAKNLEARMHNAMESVMAPYFVDHTASYSNNDFGSGNPAQTYQQVTPHADSPNPASTGWAASADPGGWAQPVTNSSVGRWESMLHHGFVMTAAGDTSKPPTHAGVALKAADTGRLHMIQRSNKDEKDPARGTWEFPGGGREDGDLTSLHTGIREWEEEVGQKFPEGGHVTHVHRSGNYVLHVVNIPEESQVDLSQGRATVNPDDPDGDDHEQSAWWDTEHARKNPALREECKSSPWGAISKAASFADDGKAADDVCGNCGEHIHETGDSVAPWVHSHTGNSFCDVHGTDDAVLLAGSPLDRPEAQTTFHEASVPGEEGSVGPFPTQYGMDHVYARDVHSGAGNCVCGGAPQDAVHVHSPLGGGYRPSGQDHLTLGPKFHVDEYDLAHLHTMSSDKARFLTIDEARAVGQAEVARTGKSAEQLLREGPSLQRDIDDSMMFFAELHDEPEPALPSTTGDNDVDDEDPQAVDEGVDGPPEAVPGLPTTNTTPWGYPPSAADHPNPAVAQPGSADLDMEGDTENPADNSTLFRSESARQLTVPDGVPEEMAATAAANPAVAGFMQTAGFKSLLDGHAAPQSGGVEVDGVPNDNDIAAAARAMLTKTSMKDFSFAEQQELIREGGGKARARNFGDLKIEGTHYASLPEDVDEEDPSFLFL